MAQVIIEDLDQVVMERLEAIAKKHGRSVQAELKHIIETAIQAQTLKESDPLEVVKTSEELGWPPGFFERTFGCLRDDPIIRWPQGEYEEREQLV